MKHRIFFFLITFMLTALSMRGQHDTEERLRALTHAWNDAHTAEEMIVDGARYMIFIIGVRFLTDYFNNDVYFKISYSEENFVRARNQFVLLQRLEEIEPQLRTIAKKYFE